MKTIIIFIFVIGFILILNSSSSNSQYQSKNYANNQTLAVQNIPIATSTPKPIVSIIPIPVKPTSKSISLATSLFSYAGSEKSQLIKKFANGTDDLSLAITNFALALDKDPEWAKKVELAIYAYLLSKGTQNNYGGLYFNGYPCTDDCSGHEAGYDWAEEHDIDNVDDCGGNSDSFIEGCQSYVEENYPEEYDSDNYEDY